MRLRASVACTGICLAVAVSLSLSDTARAQGFFQKLFGIGEAPAAREPMRLGHPSQGHGPVQGHDPGFRTGPVPEARPRRSLEIDWDRLQRSRSSEREAGGGSGKVQTLCVRTCDGYYFPISRSTARRNLHLDARACSARCGTEARLFYMAEDNDDKSGMTDLTGRTYGDLPNAFKYRKTLIEGCACRPDPWSAAELERHRAYADADAEKNGAAASPSIAAAADQPRHALPPPVSGPGVRIITAGEDIVAGNAPDTGARGDASPVHVAPIHVAIASARAADARAADQAPDDTAGQQAPAASGEEVAASEPPTHRRRRKDPGMRALRLTVPNASEPAAGRRERRERRAQLHRGRPHARTASYAVGQNGVVTGWQPKYAYPGDPVRR